MSDTLIRSRREVFALDCDPAGWLFYLALTASRNCSASALQKLPGDRSASFDKP
jgi:hypothetical protein